MPLTRIAIPAHLSRARARALADAVHEGLVATCNVPERDRFQLITRFAPDAMILDPSFPDMRRTPDASVVEITFLQGRSDEQKARLYHHVVLAAVAAGFAPDDILIGLTENAPIDWSLGRGEAYGSRADAPSAA